MFLISLESPQRVGFNEGNLKFFRPKVHEILNFELKKKMKMLIKLQKVVLKGKLNWATSSHLANGQATLDTIIQGY